jgi:hypothetical protein
MSATGCEPCRGGAWFPRPGTFPASACAQPAARLFAKAEALLQAEAAAFSLPARNHYERADDCALEALGDDAYQAAAIAGIALTLEQSLAAAETVMQ